MPGVPSRFVRVIAQAPSWEACDHFGAHRVLEGIRCLSADRLQGALQRAIAHTARHCGVSASRVEALVDADRVSALLRELRDHGPACEQMARAHGASLTSFVVERCTISAGAVAYLSALASRFSDDEFIVAPVSRLGNLLAQWDDVLDRFGERLEADASLAAARRRKLAVRAGLGAVLLAAAGVLAGWLIWRHLVVEGARARLARELAIDDPCHTPHLDSSEMRHARDDQLEALRARRDRCARQTALRAREEGCASLAANVEAGKWEDTDTAIAGASAPLLRRMSSRALGVADLRVGDDAMPCQETAAGVRLWEALARVAAESPPLWAEADAVSPRLLGLLVRPGNGLSEVSRKALVSHAETVSRRAIVVGLPDALAHARKLCALQASLSVPPDRGCKALERLASTK